VTAPRTRAAPSLRPIAGAAEPAPRASLLDDLLFNARFLVPTTLQGTFARRRWATALVTRLALDPAAQRSVRRLRRRGNGYFRVHLGTTPALLVLDPRGVARVLEGSPLEFADGEAKRSAMSWFQPHAVAISRGEEWRERRRFNEAVLATGQLHPDAAAFVAAIAEEVERARRLHGQPDRWEWFDALFRRISVRVVLGPEADDDATVAQRLGALLREADRPAVLRPRRSRHLDPLYARLRSYLTEAREPSLAAACGDAPSTPRTRVEGQLPHWLFASAETLAVNTIRALALITSHPPVENRLRAEIERGQVSAAFLARCPLLEGCLQEAMRLWPTTPILVREALRPTILGGVRLSPGDQIVILTAFHARDREAYPDADRFAPDAWSRGSPSPLFLHFGGGAQVCPGRDLALLLAKAVLALLLRSRRFRLLGPPLRPERPLPWAYDHFRVRFEVV
jgi:cytochrome P450